MKKLLLLAAGAFVAMSANATTWAVVGAYTNPNWNFEASTVLEGTGDVLSCEIAHLIGDFKIVDIDESSWAIQYGTDTPVELGQSYVLQGKDGGDDPANIKFAGNILAVNDATVTWNPTTFEMTVTGTAETGFPTLYATGSFNSWTTPGDDADYICAEENGIYTVTIDLGDSGDVEFKLAGEGWSNEIAGGVTVLHEPVEVTKGGANLKTTLSGEQTLVFDYNEMTMYFEGEGGEVEPGPGPEIPSDAPEMLYFMGNVVDNSWDPENAIAATSATNGVFVFQSIELMNGDNSGTSWFTFINTLNSDWNVINDGTHRYGPAAGEDGALVEDQVVKFSIGGDVSFNIPDGTYSFVVDFNTMELYAADPAGVETIKIDLNAPAVYYNLNGVRVDNPQNGIFIMRQGNKAIKVVK